MTGAWPAGPKATDPYIAARERCQVRHTRVWRLGTIYRVPTDDWGKGGQPRMPVPPGKG